MSKNDYRTFFANVAPFIRFTYFCKLTGVSPVNLSRFMKGEEWNYEMSIDKCHKLYVSILEHFENIA